jgi:pimeloyl-ACP methyl ester carboxylesterase
MDAPGAVPDLTAWEARGHYRTVNGLRIFVIDEGPRDAPVLLLLHGFPSCSFDFWRVLPALTAHFRVIAHDHPGFGLSARPHPYSWSLLAQADMAEALWAGMGITRGHLLAHDYSTSIAAELFMRAHEGRLTLALDRVVLTNSGFFYHMAGLRPGQHALRIAWLRPLASRLMSGPVFRYALAEVFAKKDGYTPRELQVLWELARREGGKLALGRASHYLEERRHIHTRRWLDGLRACTRPVLVLWGDRDPVGVPAIAERLCAELPQAELHWLRGTGHYPMLESAQEFSAAVLAFLQAA